MCLQKTSLNPVMDRAGTPLGDGWAEEDLGDDDLKKTDVAVPGENGFTAELGANDVAMKGSIAAVESTIGNGADQPVSPASCSERFLEFVSGVQFSLYLSHSLSAWSDRMWAFAGGLFMANLSSEGSLQLVAAYGVTTAISILLFGALIGDIVDKTARFRMVAVSLIIQNSLVLISALLVFFLFSYPQFFTIGSALYDLFIALVILTSTGAALASLALTIAVEKDWVPHIQKNKPNDLAKMNSTLRAMDLINQILAPIVVGFIAKADMKWAALFIALWNCLSMFPEFALLYRVYQLVPTLAIKEPKEVKPDAAESGGKTNYYTDLVYGLLRSILSSFATLFNGWSVYWRYPTKWAGLGLASLYMTVLGFDNITIAYTYHQGLSEDVMGAMMGLAGFVGILATFTFPTFIRKLGVDQTGRIGFVSELVFLCLCLVSIRLPGSPFLQNNVESGSTDGTYLSTNSQPSTVFSSSTTLSAGPPTLSINSSTTTLAAGLSTLPINSSSTIMTTVLSTLPFNSSTTVMPTVLSTLLFNSSTTDTSVTEPSGQSVFTKIVKTTPNYISLIVFLCGMVGARYGLWTADLSVTQVLIEEVDAGSRGVVNGVQSSLNKLMDILKYVLVLAVYQYYYFGYLIILSWLCVAMGTVFFFVFTCISRGKSGEGLVTLVNEEEGETYSDEAESSAKAEEYGNNPNGISV